MIVHHPVIDIHGTTVYEVVGAQRTTHRLPSHEAAIEFAAELEERHDAQREARRVLDQAHFEAGWDIVLPHPDDPNQLDTPDPEPEPVVSRPAVQVSVDGVVMENNYVVTVPPAVVEWEAANPSSGDETGIEEHETQVEPAPLNQGELGVTIGHRYNPESGRIVLDIATVEAVTLWRRAGSTTSVFELEAGAESNRSYKAGPGDLVEIRVGDETGPLLLQTTIPAPADSPADGESGGGSDNGGDDAVADPS